MEGINVPVDNARLVVSLLGGFVGKNLIEIKRRSVNLNYSDDILNGVTTTSKEIWLWETKPIYIDSFSHFIDGNGRIVVKFNDDESLTMPLINVKEINDVFPKINPTSMREVFENAKANNRRAIFVDYPGAAQQVVNLNKGSKMELSILAERLLKDIATIEDANTIEKNTCEMEMAKMGSRVVINTGGLI